VPFAALPLPRSLDRSFTRKFVQSLSLHAVLLTLIHLPLQDRTQVLRLQGALTELKEELKLAKDDCARALTARTKLEMGLERSQNENKELRAALAKR
jgi:hypothetical protein